MDTPKKYPHGNTRRDSRFQQNQPTNNTHIKQLDFRLVLAEFGLCTKDRVVPDGKLHRFHVESDKPGSKNGWYVFYEGCPAAGAFGSWKTGSKVTWCAKSDCDLSPAEREEYRRRMNAARTARETEERKRRAAARDRATVIWKAASLASDDHPYLVRKAVHNYGLRLHKGALVVPLRDSAGILHSLQFIDSDGKKRFLSDGRKSGCYFAIGHPRGSICIAEGYATAASIHEATSLPVAVAFDAGNLLSVAQTLRTKFLHMKIIICADDDNDTPGNPGLKFARIAATRINGYLTIAGVRT